jgi:hypothetical protein
MHWPLRSSGPGAGSGKIQRKMSRLVCVLLFGYLVSACAGSTEVEAGAPPIAGGAGGQSGVDPSGWATGGSASSGGDATAGGSSGTSAGGAAGSTSSKPYYLPDGRTFDQATDYIQWEGSVSFVSLKHKDQTSLPSGEGGTSCSGGCDEQVTRLEAGASIWGRFTGITAINVQLASTDEPGAGQGVLSVCDSDLPSFDLATSSSGLPGFNNFPVPAQGVSPTDDCVWELRAVGGFVYFRAVTVTSPTSSGTGGGPA